MEGPSDASLVLRMACGDQQALAALYERHSGRLLAYLMQLLRDRGAAEEALQDTWLAAWEGASRYRGQSSVSTWLFGIAHHKATRLLRKRLPVPVEEMAGEAERAAASTAWLDPAEAFLRREETAWIAGKLRDLSPLHRATLYLVCVEGLSLKETARVMGCPVGTVKSRLSYARRHLLSLLEETPDAASGRAARAGKSIVSPGGDEALGTPACE